MVSAIQLRSLWGTERNGITCKEILKSSFVYVNRPCLFCVVAEVFRVIFSVRHSYVSIYFIADAASNQL